MTRHDRPDELVDVDELRTRVEDSDAVSRTSEVGHGRIGTYESLFALVDELGFETEVNVRHPVGTDDFFVVTGQIFSGLGVGDVAELFDAVHPDAIRDVEADSDGTATVILSYD